MRVNDKWQHLQQVREKLATGGYSLGTWMQITNADVGEILSTGPFDWIAIDWEHGAFDQESLKSVFRAIESGGCLPFARLPIADEAYCKWALDSGAAGVIVPMVRSAEEVAQALAWSAWPPAGVRGVGFSRGNLYGHFFDEYKPLGQQPFFVPIIENKQALSNLEAIVEVPGVDAIFIGPYDLSASLGCMGDFDSPVFVSAMNQIAEICSEASIPFGMHVVQADPNELHRVQGLGYRFNAYSIDTVMLRGQIEALTGMSES